MQTAFEQLIRQMNEHGAYPTPEMVGGVFIGMSMSDQGILVGEDGALVAPRNELVEPSAPEWRFANAAVVILATFTDPLNGESITSLGTGVYIGDNRVLTVAHIFKQPHPRFKSLSIIVDKASIEKPVDPQVINFGYTGVSATMIDSYPARVGETIPAKAFTVLTTLVDFAVIELSAPIEGLVPMTPETPPIEDRLGAHSDFGGSRELVLLTVNRYPHLDKLLASYSKKMDKDELIQSVQRLYPDQLSLARTSESSYMTFMRVTSEDQTKCKTRLTHDPLHGNILVYPLSSLEGASGGMIIRGGRWVGLHKGIMKRSLNDKKMCKDSCGQAVLFDSNPAKFFLGRMLGPFIPSSTKLGDTSNGLRFSVDNLIEGVPNDYLELNPAEDEDEETIHADRREAYVIQMGII